MEFPTASLTLSLSSFYYFFFWGMSNSFSLEWSLATVPNRDEEPLESGHVRRKYHLKGKTSGRKGFGGIELSFPEHFYLQPQQI